MSTVTTSSISAATATSGITMYSHKGAPEELGGGLVVTMVMSGVGMLIMTASLQFPLKMNSFTARTCRGII